MDDRKVLTKSNKSNPNQFIGKFECIFDKFFINVKHVCDGYFDCFDKSDEKNCTNFKESSFLCHDKKQYIGIQLVCDFVQDCHDNSDELNCCKISSI